MTTHRLTLFAGIVLAGFTLGACATTPLYKEQTSSLSAGYSEQKLDESHYRISFAGKRSTSRMRVEDGLMLRSAEVARAAGYSHFLIDERETQREDDWASRRDPWGWGYGPRFAFNYGYGFGRRGFYDPFYYRFGYYTDRFNEGRFVASADISLLTQGQAASEPRAISADQVIANLGPRFAEPPVR